MSPDTKKLFKGSKKDEIFLREILAADPANTPPGYFADTIEEHLWCGVYYGWLVARHGKDWKAKLGW